MTKKPGKSQATAFGSCEVSFQGYSEGSGARSQAVSVFTLRGPYNVVSQWTKPTSTSAHHILFPEDPLKDGPTLPTCLRPDPSGGLGAALCRSVPKELFRRLNMSLAVTEE